MTEKKDCMFQYAISYKWLGTDLVEDTDLITLSEAKELWHRYLPDFIKHMSNREVEGCSPEMAIWSECESNTCYAKEYAHVDYETEVDGDSVYNITRKKVEV